MYGFTVITNVYDLIFTFANHSGAFLQVNEPLGDEYDNFTFLFDDPEIASAMEKEFDSWYDTLLEGNDEFFIEIDFDNFH